MILSKRDYSAGPLVWAGIIGVTCLILFLFQKILWLVVPFILALIIYYLLLPIKLKLVMRGISHDMAAGIAGGGAMLLLALVLLVLMPGVLREAVNWHESAMRYVDGGLQLVFSTAKQLEGRFEVLEQAHVADELAHKVKDFTEHFAQTHLPGLVMGVAAWAPALLLAPFLAFFMLRDGWRFRMFLGRAVPNAFFERSLYLSEQVDRTARLYFLGLIKLTVLDTFCLAVGLWLIGMDSALLLGLLAAVLAWIPFIGSVIGCVLVVLVAATNFPGDPEIVYAAIALFVFVRLLDDFIFMPMTIGKSLNMHPLLTVLMIFVGGAVAGVPGLMLVLPVMGVIMVVGETIGDVLSDPRLKARHLHAKRLWEKRVTQDLRA